MIITLFFKKRKISNYKKAIIRINRYEDVLREQPGYKDYACFRFHVLRKNNLHKHLSKYKKQFFTLW